MSYIAERRQEEKERRSDEIVAAAEELYRELGWDAVTMDGVARRARLSRALVYVYFKDNILLGRDFSPRCQTLPGTAAVVNAVAKDPNGIGYGGAAYAKGVKDCAVRRDEKSPAVTRERLYLDMMQSVLGSSSKVLVDQPKGGQSLLYLPLDKLMQQAGTPAPVTGATEPARTAPAPDQTVTLDPAQRAREALRNRDGREAR